MGAFRNVTNLGAVVTLFGGDWLLWIFITKVWSVHHIIIVMFINGVCYRGSSKKSRRGSPSGGSPSPIELSPNGVSSNGVSPNAGSPMGVVQEQMGLVHLGVDPLRSVGILTSMITNSCIEEKNFK